MKIRKGDTVCRICKHPYTGHCLYVQLSQGGMIQPAIKPLEVVPCNGYGLTDGQPCGCMTYEPIDNLEYLEWKADQKSQQTFDDTTW